MSYFNRSFYENIAMSGYSNIVPWSKIGYSPTIDTTESDLWSKAGVYTFLSAAAQLQITSSYSTADTTRDIGTVIHGNAEGANNTIIADSGSTTTSLYDSSVNFTSGTSVAIGDCILLDPKGTTPEWGYITDITDAATGTLIVAGGFSNGGSPYQSGAGRAYTIVDKSAYSGAHVAKINYLTNTYAEKTILMCLNANTAVTTKDSAGNNLSDLYRINSFRIVAAGSTNVLKGNLSLTNTAGTTTYSYITAGFTRARNNMYTVPLNKSVYVVGWNIGWSTPNDTKVQAARFYTRANIEPETRLKTDNIFYPYTETIISNSQEVITFAIPTYLPAKTDLKVSGIAFTAGAGAASSVLRGYIVS